MTEEVDVLVEIMLQAEVFCASVESNTTKLPRIENEELRLKISQCRGTLKELQAAFDENELHFASRRIRGMFRHLVMSLLWLSFIGGRLIDRRLYRKVVQIESSFTYLLVTGYNTAIDDETRTES